MRGLRTLGWLATAAVVLLLVTGPVGFSPTDEGYLLSQAYRALNGDVPHVDFVVPRPALSVYLHAVELLVPGPLFVVTRVLAVLQVALYSAALVTLVRGRPPWRWEQWDGILAALALAINLHVFPLMTWYTIDGLLLVALGFALLAGARSPRTDALAMLLLGLGAVTKQSFLPAVAIGSVVLALRYRRTPTSLLPALAAAAVPPAAYVLLVVGAGGGLGELGQLTSGEAVYGDSLYLSPGPAAIVAAVVLGAAGSVALRGGTVLLRATRLVAGAAPVVAIAVWGLSRGEPWAEFIWWQAAAIAVVGSLVGRSLDLPALLLLALAWMATLSWGYSTPALVGGSLLVLVLDRLELRPPASRSRAVVAVGVVAVSSALVLVAALRLQEPYRDRPSGALTFRLSSVSPEFGPIRTNPTTGAFMADVKACADERPAGRQVVLPDGAWAYPTFGWTNPLPTDWPLPDDVRGSERRILDATRELRARGDYLVLWTPVIGFALPGLSRAAMLAAGPDISATGRPIVEAILAVLGAPHGRCGALFYWYAPGAP